MVVRSWGIVVLAGAGVLLTAAPAVAREPSGSGDDERVDVARAEQQPTREHWYGWQTLAPDGVAAGLFLGAIPAHVEDGYWIGGATVFALGAPIVHLAHGRPLTALGDFTLRLAAPVLGMFIGGEIDAHQPWKCEAKVPNDPDPSCAMSTTYMTAGGLLMAAGVSALDATVFAFEPRPFSGPRYTRPSNPHVWPTLAMSPNSGRVGLVGSF